MNVLVISGRLVRDPEVRTTPNGKTVASFTLVVKRAFKSPDGVDADFFRCEAWEKTAEFLEKYAEKGSTVTATGPLEERVWDDKDGNKRSTWTLKVNQLDVQFKDKPTDDGASTSKQKSAPKSEKTVDEYDPFADE